MFILRGQRHPFIRPSTLHYAYSGDVDWRPSCDPWHPCAGVPGHNVCVHGIKSVNDVTWPDSPRPTTRSGRSRTSAWIASIGELPSVGADCFRVTDNNLVAWNRIRETRVNGLRTWTQTLYLETRWLTSIDESLQSLDHNRIYNSSKNNCGQTTQWH